MDWENKAVLQGTLTDVSIDSGYVKAMLRIEREHESALHVECYSRYLPDSSRVNLVPGNRVCIRGEVASYADGALAVAMSTVADTSDSRDFSDVEITGMLDKVIVPKASFLIANILPEKDSFFRIHIGPWISADGTVMCQVLGEFINNFSKNDVIHAKGCLSERLFMPGLPKLYIVPSYILERDRLNPDLKKEPVVEKDSGGWEY